MVDLPYSKGFDQPYFDQLYDEYPRCQQNLPVCMKNNKVGCKRAYSKVNYPCGPKQVAQNVEWLTLHLFLREMSKCDMKLVKKKLNEKTLKGDFLPLITQFDIDSEENTGFNLMYGDTITVFNPLNIQKSLYSLLDLLPQNLLE